MQQFFEFLLSKQESPAAINYSLVYRHIKGLYAFEKEIGLNSNIILSDQISIKCMAVSRVGIAFGGDFGIVHIGSSINEFDIKANTLSFSQDNEYIIANAKETHLISTKTHKLIKSFPDHIQFDSTNSLCFCRGSVFETATFSELKQFKCPEVADFSISVQRDSLYLSHLTLIKHLEELRDCKLTIENYNTGLHFEYVFPAANEVKQLWSPDGKILLLWSQVLDDHTNQSYFGTHNLHLWTENKLIKIEVFEGPIHDVKWVQNGFIVISGYMPAGAVLFNQQGQKQYLILQAHINAIFPKNNLIALAGFGNLSGEIFIYDLNIMEKVGSLKQDKVVSFQWSPSGEYFLLATTFPRLRVDNQFIICKKNGQSIHKQKFDELYEIKWINDEHIVVENNQTDIPTESKQVNLTTGVDFIKQMKEAQINVQPRKLSNDETLQSLRPAKQQPQLVPTNQISNGKQQSSKPAPVLMRRQEPLVQQQEHIVFQETVQNEDHLKQMEENRNEKGQQSKRKKKLNLRSKPIQLMSDYQFSLDQQL